MVRESEISPVLTAAIPDHWTQVRVHTLPPPRFWKDILLDLAGSILLYAVLLVVFFVIVHQWEWIIFCFGMALMVTGPISIMRWKNYELVISDQGLLQRGVAGEEPMEIARQEITRIRFCGRYVAVQTADRLRGLILSDRLTDFEEIRARLSTWSEIPARIERWPTRLRQSTLRTLFMMCLVCGPMLVLQNWDWRLAATGAIVNLAAVAAAIVLLMRGRDARDKTRLWLVAALAIQSGTVIFIVAARLRFLVWLLI